MIPENSLTDNLIALLEEYLEETELDTQDKLVIVKALDKIIYQRELSQLKEQGLHRKFKNFCRASPKEKSISMRYS